MNKNLFIGLFGFGCVGQGLFAALNLSDDEYLKINKVCVQDKNKERSIPKSMLTFNKSYILQNKKINTIVELIVDTKAALEIATFSLKNGKNTVSANKKMIAENLFHLYNLQKKFGSSILYEGAVAGCIPIIRTIEEYYKNEKILSIRGVLNGSSNYILSKMELDNLLYSDALEKAQEYGFAESDPTLDVKGFDSKYKTCILAAHSYGIILDPVEVFNLGIQNISVGDIEFAYHMDLRIKLISTLYENTDGICAYVLPCFVSKNNPLSSLNSEFNGIEICGEFSGFQYFIGKGAGSYPTGAAVLSDVTALSINYKYSYQKMRQREKYESVKKKPFNNILLSVYIRFSDEKDILELKLVKILKKSYNYILCEINLENLVKAKKDLLEKLFICAFQN
jgi:homoserine dehydrogenase